MTTSMGGRAPPRNGIVYGPAGLRLRSNTVLIIPVRFAIRSVVQTFPPKNT